MPAEISQLDLPVKSTWYEPPKNNEITGNRNRDHETLIEAIIFVMEELDESVRHTVWIRSENAGYLIAEIQAAYQKIADPLSLPTDSSTDER